MNRYTVEYERRVRHAVVIEAASAEEAERTARRLAEEGGLDAVSTLVEHVLFIDRAYRSG